MASDYFESGGGGKSTFVFDFRANIASLNSEFSFCGVMRASQMNFKAHYLIQSFCMFSNTCVFCYSGNSQLEKGN